MLVQIKHALEEGQAWPKKPPRKDSFLKEGKRLLWTTRLGRNSLPEKSLLWRQRTLFTLIW